jgi:ABC-type amino acid transport system permease subunit
MLPIAFAALLAVFAALLGVVLGRFFKVAILAPGVAATTILAVVVEWSNGASLLTLLVVVALSAVMLQFGYLIGSWMAHPISSPQGLRSHAPSAEKDSTDL